MKKYDFVIGLFNSEMELIVELDRLSCTHKVAAKTMGEIETVRTAQLCSSLELMYDYAENHDCKLRKP